MKIAQLGHAVFLQLPFLLAISVSIPTLIPSQAEAVFSVLCTFYLNFHVVNQECSHDHFQVNNVGICFA